MIFYQFDFWQIKANSVVRPVNFQKEDAFQMFHMLLRGRLCVNIHILQFVFQCVVSFALKELYFKFMTQLGIFLFCAYIKDLNNV